MIQNSSLQKVIYVAGALLCLMPFIQAPVALFLGLVVAFVAGTPYPVFNKSATKWLLQIAVVGLGFGMNIHQVIDAGSSGLLFTVLTIVLGIIVGVFLGKAFKVPSKAGYLISAGTSICGGSAIAALGPIIKANDDDMSISLGTIFIFNALALFIFPAIGHLFNMSQQQFGLWSAIAIHDTSSVVGAASKYGDEALHIATTIKLTRALWIIPLSLVTSFFFKSGKGKIYIPYFIFFYILAVLVTTFVPGVSNISSYIVEIAKRGLTLTLYFIGSGLSKKTLQTVGFRPVLQGAVLWVIISIITLAVILLFNTGF